jgi:LysR family transcriptional regulator, hca operon transcriptional activator
MVILPSDHRLAALNAISPRDLVGETFVAVSNTAPVLRVVIDKYLKRSGVNITPEHEADHLSMGMSLIASTGGVGLLPVYAQNFLPSSITSRPLKGDTPTVDLVFGYKKSNQSPILKLLLSRLDELVARASNLRHRDCGASAVPSYNLHGGQSARVGCDRKEAWPHRFILDE